MTSVEQLAYSTVLIECVNADGSAGSGTGFFVELEPNKETHAPMLVLITNKHVVGNAKKLTLVFTVRQGDEPSDEKYRISLDNFRSLWRFHPYG